MTAVSIRGVGLGSSSEDSGGTGRADGAGAANGAGGAGGAGGGGVGVSDIGARVRSGGVKQMASEGTDETPRLQYPDTGTGKKTPGEPGHSRDTRTGAHTGTTRNTQTNLTTIPTHHRTHTHMHTHDRTTTETAADNGTSVFGRRENREVH